MCKFLKTYIWFTTCHLGHCLLKLWTIEEIGNVIYLGFAHISKSLAGHGNRFVTSESKFVHLKSPGVKFMNQSLTSRTHF